MKTLIVAVGLFLLSAFPVLAGPSAPDQDSTQFHALAALNGSQSATLQPAHLQTLTDAELKAITGGDNPHRQLNPGGNTGGCSNNPNCTVQQGNPHTKKNPTGSPQ